MTSQTMTFEQTIDAPASQVYRAFTNASALREWLCDVATTAPHVGGRIYMAWNSGFYTAGEYTGLESDQKVTFTWRGRDDPDVSQVHVIITPQNGAVLLRLEHTTPKSGEEWAMTIEEIAQGWRSSLENLASVLDAGEDLRITRRPMMGIYLGDFNSEIAARLGVPTVNGARLDGVAPGMGAQAAGLQGDDVFVSINGRTINSFADIAPAIQGRQAGDVVPVVFYRGGEQRTVDMQLSRRPLPEIPATPAELASQVRDMFDKVEADLQTLFQGVSDAEASFKPAPSEWSAKQTLAHLIQGERYGRFIIAEMVGGFESWSDGWSGNLDEPLQATVLAYPTLADLLVELQRNFTETVAFYAALPESFRQRKSTYWRMAFNALQGPDHFYSHMEQMRLAIAAARQ